MIKIVKIIYVSLLHFFFRFLLLHIIILSSVAIACFFVNLVAVAFNGSSGQGCLTDHAFLPLLKDTSQSKRKVR
jgi:hypothetical protein